MKSTKKHSVIFAGILLIGLCSAASVSAQMGSGYMYSDSWLVSPGNQDTVYEEGDSLSGYYVVGAGVTDESYNNYGHECWVNTTLTSPSGQTASNGGGSGGSYAEAETTIPWDFNDPDIGDFFVESEHGYFCPIASRDFDLGSTFDLIGYGFSQMCYEFAYASPGVDVYFMVDDCASNITCPGPGTLFIAYFFNAGNNIIRWEFFVTAGAKFCVNKHVMFRARFGCGSEACRDLSSR